MTAPRFSHPLPQPEPHGLTDRAALSLARRGLEDALQRLGRFTLLSFLALLLLPGCSVLEPQPDLTRFYVLRLPPAKAQAEAQTGAVPPELRLGPGTLPGYLESTSIALQDGTNRIRYLDLDHWAEPLPKGFDRALRESLIQLLPVARISVYPEPVTAFSSIELRYTVNRFEGTLDGPVALDVSWELFQRPAVAPLAGKRSVYVVPRQEAQPDGVDAYVLRLSRAINLWAADVAKAIPSRPASQ